MDDVARFDGVDMVVAFLFGGVAVSVVANIINEIDYVYHQTAAVVLVSL